MPAIIDTALHHLLSALQQERWVDIAVHAVGWMQDGRKTVVGFGLEDPAESALLREIGPQEREIYHLGVGTVDHRFDVVCAGIEVDPPPSPP